jgi:hypothetical protein
LQPGTGGFTDRSSWLVDMPTDLHLSGQLSAQRPCLSAIWPCGRRSRRGEIARDHGRRPLPAIQGLADASSTCPDDPRDQHEIVRLVHQEGHQAGLPEWQGPPRAWASLAQCTTASSTCRSGRPHRSLDLQAPDDDQHVITFPVPFNRIRRHTILGSLISQYESAHSHPEGCLPSCRSGPWPNT